LQLHQVQEELEHYFLKYQELESSSRSNKLFISIEQEKENNLPLCVQLIQVDDELGILNINLINLRWKEHNWPQYSLKIISSDISDNQIKQPSIRLPEQKNNLLPLKTWPPQTADESGAYWEIDSDLLSDEMTNSHFYTEDIAFLYQLFEQLPLWLKVLEKTNHSTHDDWSSYYQAIDELKLAIDPVYKLQLG
jgi:hypothetical protein